MPKIITCDTIPEGHSGNMRIEHKDPDTMLVRTWNGESPMPKGSTWVGLFEGNNMWMSNTPDEKRDISIDLSNMGYTEGQTILIGGLGLGFFMEWFQQDRHVPEHLHVIEKNADVINFVQPHYESLPWLCVEHGDIWEYGKVGPHKQFDWCYVDIWGNYNTDLLEEMKKLRQSLRPLMKPGKGRIILWKEAELKRQRRRGY